jgi:hypothetical protein|tara:strand:- start:390 stop:545 length:156 start_codon:yes stop_codon:yes gene_type:complete
MTKLEKLRAELASAVVTLASARSAYAAALAASDAYAAALAAEFKKQQEKTS